MSLENAPTWVKKILFFGGAILVLVLKVYGLIATALAWPFAIILGFIGVITEPERAY